MASIVKPRGPRLSKDQRRQRQTRKAPAARRQLRHLHDQLPRPARALFDTLGRAFTRATALLPGAALLTVVTG